MKWSYNNTKIITITDASAALLSLYISYQLRFNFEVPHIELQTLYFVLPIYFLLRIGANYVFQLSKIIIRFTSLNDAKRILLSVCAGSIVFVILNFISFLLYSKYIFPISVICIDLVFYGFILLGYRMILRWFYEDNRTEKTTLKKVVIFGAGEAGVLTKNSLQRSLNSYHIIAFIDDDAALTNKKIDAIPVVHSTELSDIIEKKSPEIVILAALHISIKRKNELADLCLNAGVQLLSVPHTDKWMNGILEASQLEKIKFEDLLSRDAIQLDIQLIASTIFHKTIVITGAAGSIGSELARQVIRFNPSTIILVDMAESALFEIDNELKYQKNSTIVLPYLVDIKDKKQIEAIFLKHEPNIVLHAAAYKHVPLMETFAQQAINNNVIGTKNVLALCTEYNIEKFVFVSTDKAVNPTNIMGASKRVAERLVQYEHQKDNKTQFITTRFGNVLGSNGSVIPTFKKQIEKGGPVTVTHPEVTRYFMTIPEACQLVLEAAAIGKGGELMLFDMGEMVKIDTLAKRMIQLSGKQIGKDIEIVYTGLRPGEKLYEELLTANEDSLPTHHPKIVIGKNNTIVNEDEYTQILTLLEQIDNLSNKEIKLILEQIVPEYKPN